MQWGSGSESFQLRNTSIHHLPQQQRRFVPLASPLGASGTSACLLDEILLSEKALWLFVAEEGQPMLLSWRNPKALATDAAIMA